MRSTSADEAAIRVSAYRAHVLKVPYGTGPHKNQESQSLPFWEHARFEASAEAMDSTS